jgi:hypothetical protein
MRRKLLLCSATDAVSAFESALCRVAEEQTEDINFILFPRGESGEPSERQIQMIEEFFQEEFADPTETVRNFVL